MYHSHVIPLPYLADTLPYFLCVRDLSWSVYLDTCHPHSQQGRYDIITAQPFIRLITHGQTTSIIRDTETTHTIEDPFITLKQILCTYPQADFPLPFAGGAVGYFSYDLSWRIEPLPHQAPSVINAPDMAVGIYDWAIITDHQEEKTYLIQGNRHDKTAAIVNEVKQRLASVTPRAATGFQLTEPLHSNTSYEEYQSAFAKIQSYLQQGDCYQVNYAHCFSAPYIGDPLNAYQQLRKINPVPFAGYLNFPNISILSLSPERFLHVKANQVTTQPIKGTCKRRHGSEDEEAAKQLRHSAKDTAENIMIVDLMRNDLSKSCHNVKVPHLCHLESFTGVHHLVSTITATAYPDKHSLDIFRDCFPAGSITGAPKIRAMEIIEQLESQKRSIYCGAIGYISFTGEMDMNIPIRTMLCTNNTLYTYAGGGITIDSQYDAEYQETLSKIATITQCLEENFLKR